MSSLQEDLMAQMRQVSLSDREAHTRLVLALQVSQAISKHLWLLIQTGKEAEQSIKLRGSRID